MVYKKEQQNTLEFNTLSERVIKKVKCRKEKQSITYKCKNLGTKFQKRLTLKFSEKSLLLTACIMKVSSLHINVYKSRVPASYILRGFSTIL